MFTVKCTYDPNINWNRSGYYGLPFQTDQEHTYHRDMGGKTGLFQALYLECWFANTDFMCSKNGKKGMMGGWLGRKGSLGGGWEGSGA